MRVAGVEPSPLRRLFPLIVVVLVLAAGVGVVLWGRQQDAARRVAENRADLAETEVAAAQASLTAIVRVNAATTATAVASTSEPEMALRRSLDLVFAAYKDPSEGKLKALTDAFSSDALAFERTEAEHLISGGLHLAGATPYQLQVMSTTTSTSGDVDITTHEIWTYDEVDNQSHPVRCVREESDQSYTLRNIAAGWRVEDVALQGAPRRMDC
jgi:hypothetical protein